MRKLFCLLLMIVILFLPVSAIAKPYYIEGGVSSVSLDFHRHDNFRTVGPEFVFGGHLTENISIEGHYMEGDGKEDGYKFDLQTISGFVKINFFTSCESTDKEKAQLYALLGFTQMELEFPDKIPASEVDKENLKRLNEVTSFSYGAGFSVPILKRGHLRVEYNHLIDDGFYECSSIIARVGIKF